MKKRIVSIALVLALLVSVLSMSALATVNYLTPGANITNLTLSLSDYTANRTDETFTYAGFTNNRYTYDISVPPTVANNAQITITFTPDSTTVVSPMPPQGQPGMWIPRIMGTKTNTYTVTLSNGVGNKVVYVHRQLLNANGQPVGTYYGQCDIYTFNFEKGYPVSISTGDPVYINWSTTNVTSGTVQLRNANGVLPDSFTLWVQGTGDVKQNGSSLPVAYSDADNYAYNVNLLTAASTVTAEVGNDTYTISVPAKPSGGSSSGSNGVSPSSVVSYLPIGQFATGGGWGTSNGKFANKTSPESTGVSLGALGGYIEFYFANGITDNPNNPYGVDFVVYGNAFAGNPEAGAVQVSENGTTWYELAGSKYYDGGFNYVGNQGASGKYANAYTGTLRNTSVAYSLITGTGIYANFGGHNDLFTTAAAWWPTTGENYPMGTPNTNSVVTVSHSNSALSFGGITAIPDSNVTADYGFGYADVTPNGSPSHYGDAVNPYTPYTSGKTGGDGFDLEWAVDITTGLPVSVANKTFHYVRVYSNVLDNGTFGETSCEVCGIFTAYRETNENTSVGRTAAPSISVAEMDILDWEPTVSYADSTVIYDIGGLYEDMVIDVSGTGSSIVNMNGVNVSSYTVTEDGQYVRIIVQNGTAAPYIVIIK
jgi:hypothetical protein